MSSQDQHRRVAITGYGMITPLGRNVKETWSALLAGRSGCTPISRFPASSFPVSIAAEVPRQFWQNLHHCSLAYTFAERVILDALTMAGSPHQNLGSKTALVVGVGGDDDGAADYTFDFIDRLICSAPNHPYSELGKVAIQSQGQGERVEQGLPLETLAPALAIRFGIEGEVLCVATACASGAHAIALAVDLLQDAEVNRVVVVGTDAMVSRLNLANFCTLGVLSQRNNSPETACRPFDTRRQGFVLGEGAGAVILETNNCEEDLHARARGYLIGYGVTADAHSITDKEPDGTGVLAAINQAMHFASVNPQDIAYINCHGTGTRQNDVGEAAAIRQAFGKFSSRVPVSSIKGQIGHTIAAAGVIEVIVTLLSVSFGCAPGTSTLEILSPDVADLNILGPGKHPIGHGFGISLSSGFGGVNVCLILLGLEGKGL